MMTKNRSDLEKKKFREDCEGKPTVSVTPSNNDSFGRTKVGVPFTMYDHKNIHNKDIMNTEELIVGAAAIDYIYNESSVDLSCGTASGDRAVRQSRRYFTYVPGKEMTIVMTGVLGNGKAGVVKRIGIYDDNDGIFFEMSETGLALVIRSSTSGSPVDTKITTFDHDISDIDFTNTQIFMINYQWLGVGVVRYSLNLDGGNRTIHTVSHANNSSLVYMKRPSLPTRYEIENIGTAANATILKEICYSVTSEGGYAIPGNEYSVSNKAALRSVTTTRTPILAVRLKVDIDGNPNRRTLRALHFSAYGTGADLYIEMNHVHAPTSITATWTDLDAESGVEYSTDVSAITTPKEHAIDAIYVPTGAGNKGNTVPQDNVFISNHNIITQNMDSDNSQVFVVYAQTISGSADVGAIMDFIEFE